MTVSVVLPVLVSLVAVICAEPAALAVTSPEVETLATVVLLDVHAITRPVRTLLFASRVSAEKRRVSPTTSVGAVGDTVTVATGAGGGGGAVTVMDDEPTWPSLDADI